MKAQLILLDNPIIVTDEEIKDGDWYFYGNRFDIKELNQFKKGTDDTAFLKEQGILKIISHNKPIDYNGIDFGIVDVEKLANAANGYNYAAKETKAPIFNEGFIEGFKASQQLNEKKFTLDDLRDAFESGECYGKTWSEFYNTDSVSRAEAERTSDFNDFIRELSLPKTFYIEIEETPTNIKIIKKL